MSDTLQLLASKIFNELMDADFCGSEAIIHQILDELGENARRMLEVGIVQDKMVELGFEVNAKFTHTMIRDKLIVDFHPTFAVIGFSVFNYDSPTWQQDLLARVRVLIGDKL